MREKFRFFSKQMRGAWSRWRHRREGVWVCPDELHTLHERLHLRRLLEYLNVDCVFDVGANAGQYARMLRNDAGFRGLIISFEPIPDRADEMREYARSDRFWHVEQVALADHLGELDFSVMRSDQFSSLGVPKHTEASIFREHNVVEKVIRVKSETLEYAFRRLKETYRFKRPFLKMDSQGFDVEILRSGYEIAHEFLGLQSELSVKKIYNQSVDFRDAISFYNEAGFDLSAIVPNNPGHFPELIEMDCIMLRRDLLAKEQD